MAMVGVAFGRPRKRMVGRVNAMMAGRSITRVAIALVVSAFLPAAGHAAAQESRQRTLTYESKQRHWVEVAPPLPGTSEGDLFVIRRLNREGKSARALSAVESFIKKYGAGDVFYPDVLVAKADALIGQTKLSKAHDTLQAMLGEYEGTGAASDALRLEFVIAESYLAGTKRRLWGMPLLSGEDLALQILGEISADYPGHQYAKLALKTKADYLFKTGSHALAELDYSRLLREYPNSRYYRYALRRVAEATLASFAGVHYDEAAIVEASERFDEYRKAFPAEADEEGVGLVIDSITEMRADKDFLVGQYYEHTSHLSSAVFYYRKVRADWPGSIAAAKATQRLELLGVLEAVPVAPSEGASGS